MITNRFLIILIVIVSLGFAQNKTEVSVNKNAASNSANSKSATKKADTLIIKARLIDIPGEFPSNDIYNYVYVMKYKVLSIVKGKYQGREILVGHYNPLIARKRITGKMDSFVDGNVEKFTVGSKHLLKLVDLEHVWTDAVEDEYYDNELPRYFALKAEAVQ